MKTKSAVAGMFIAAFAVFHGAQAAPVQFGTNFYEFVSSDGISWAAADASASAMTFSGANGHLATITSASENAFLNGLVAPFNSFAGSWIGGSESTWLVGPETGQAYVFQNFGGIEPNNAPSNAYMNVGASFAGIANGQWADAGLGLSSGADPIRGYFVEYELNAVPGPVVGAGLPGLIMAFGGLLAWRKKRKQLAA